MKRRILLIFTLLVAAVSNAEIKVEDNQMWWGYFNESDASKLPLDNGYLGYGSACTIDAAIRIPVSEEIVGVSTIKAIRLWLGNDLSGISGDMRLWISTKCPTSGTDTVSVDYKQTVQNKTLEGGLNEIELTTPFEVNHREIYVGYTIAISKNTYPIMAYDGNSVPDGFYYRINNGGWDNLYDYGYGNLALQVLLEAETFPTNYVIVNDFGQKIRLVGKSLSIPVTFSNKGQNPVKSISYTYGTVDGNISDEVTKSFSSSPMNTSGTKTYNITFPADEEARKYQKIVTVTKVNGEPNTATVNSGTGFIINVAEKPSVTPVIEEFTGTWCGWCPRGIVGMEKIHEQYGDRVVQIAAHSGDVMAISAYNAIINTFCSGYPGSVTDRQYDADPSFTGLKNVLSRAFSRTAAGSIELSAIWDSEDQKAVVFNTKTKFVYSDDDGKYAIAFVLTEDGMTGTNSNWAQQNYYNGMSVSNAGSDMAWWCTAGSPVTGIEFNHVAVAGWNVKDGVKNSVDSRIDVDKEQEYTYTGNISTNTLIQDKSKLKAIALLIDNTTGAVVNAAQSDIADFATAISDIESFAPKAQTEVFDLSGRKLQSTQSGINIIRTSGGSVKKVLVK